MNRFPVKENGFFITYFSNLLNIVHVNYKKIKGGKSI